MSFTLITDWEDNQSTYVDAAIDIQFLRCLRVPSALPNNDEIDGFLENMRLLDPDDDFLIYSL